MKIAVSVSVGTLPLVGQVREIGDALSQITPDYLIVLCCHSKLDIKGSMLAAEAINTLPNVVGAFAEKGTFSSAYLAGWATAVHHGADFIISMDADGSHDPKELRKFIEAYQEGYQVVCSSRFTKGAVNSYPLERQLISKGVTFLANLIVNKHSRLTDFASGYEGLSKQAIIDIFERLPAEKWISVTDGPYHLQNTILRLLLISCGYQIHEIPINYGVKRKGKSLGLSYISSALKGFVKLYWQFRSLNSKSKTKTAAV